MCCQQPDGSRNQDGPRRCCVHVLLLHGKRWGAARGEGWVRRGGLDQRGKAHDAARLDPGGAGKDGAGKAAEAEARTGAAAVGGEGGKRAESLLAVGGCILFVLFFFIISILHNLSFLHGSR